MEHIDWNTIVTATIGAGILTAMRFVWGWLKDNYKKHDARTTLLEIKFECMHSGLLNVNHNFGNEYKQGYDVKYEDLMSTHDFLKAKD